MTRAITAATESPTALHSGRGSSPNRRSRLACSGDVILIQFRRETSNASYGICLKHTHTRQANHMSLFILFYTQISSPRPQERHNIPLEYEVSGSEVRVAWIPLQEGRHTLSIIWRGQHVVGSPYSVVVDDSQVRLQTFIPYMR